MHCSGLEDCVNECSAINHHVRWYTYKSRFQLYMDNNIALSICLFPCLVYDWKAEEEGVCSTSTCTSY